MFKPWIKEDRRITAEKHFEECEEIYQDEIQYSIKKSKVYYGCSDDIAEVRSSKKPLLNITVEDSTTDKAVQKHKEHKWAVLNFASYRYPGGGYIIGAIAQEEALCHVSTLYNVLLNFEETYIENRKKIESGKINSLYENFGIFSPDVVFHTKPTENEVLADVITVPAPNISTKNNATNEEKDSALFDRIEFLLNIANQNNCKNLILGAFGCGVFGQDPTEVATLFKDMLKHDYNFENVIFAIPSGPNLEAFKKVFETK